MKDSVKKEVKEIINCYGFGCSIEELKDKTETHWKYISAKKILSEDFIREYQDKVNWYFISVYQKLSEDFIKEFQNKVDWELICSCQTLSEDFIREFKDKIDLEWIQKNEKISISDELRKEINNGYILPPHKIINLFPKITRSQLIDLEQ